MRNELYAHAVTLRLSLEDSYRAGRIGDAQRLIDQLSENPRVFSVILFDEEGRVVVFSNPPKAEEVVESPEARRVIAAGEPVEVVQRRSGSEVYSVVMPVRISAARRGAFEISQPTDLVKAKYAGARRIVEEHGGWIEAANRAEGGAVFTIWLPKLETTQSCQRNTEVESEKRLHHSQ